MDRLKLEVKLQAFDGLSSTFKSVMKASSELAKQLTAQKKIIDKLGADSSLITRYDNSTKALRENTLAIEAAKQKHSDLTQKLEASRSSHYDLSKEVKLARQEHKTLIAGLAKGADQVAGYSYKVERSRDKLKELEKAFSISTNSLRNQKDQIKATAKETDALTREQAKLNTDLSNSAVALNKAGIAVKDLNHQQSLLKLTAYAASGELVRQGQELDKLNAKLEKQAAIRASYDKIMQARNKAFGISTTTGIASAATLAPLGKIVTEFASAEEAATGLKVAMMDNTGKVPATFEKINQLANQLGNKLPGTTADFQNMMTMLIRQGMSAKAVLGGLGEATAYLGNILKMPMDESAKFVAQLQDATSTTEGEMLGLADVIQRSFFLGVDPGNMLGAFKGLGTVMDTMKKKGLDGAKALAPFMIMMDQTGMAGESAGNAIRKVVTRSLDLKDVTKANNLIKDKGIKLDFTDGKGEFGGIDKLMAELSKLKKLNTVDRMAVLQKIYGDDNETNQVLSKMIDKGMAGYNEIQAKLKAQAELKDRVDKNLGTLSKLWEAATGTFTNVMVALGDTISPQLKELTVWLQSLAERFQAWVKNNPALASTILKTVAIIGVLLGAISVLALVVGAIMAPFAILRLGIFQLGSTIMTLGKFMLATPILGWITAIAFVAYGIYDNWDFISKWWKGMWASITNATSEAWKSVSNFVGKWVDAGKNLMIGLGDGIMSGLGWVKDKITTAAANIIGWFKEKLGIHSPSRVFAQLGNFTMEGLSLGLSQGQKDVIKRVTTTAGLIASAGMAINTPAFASPVKFDTRPAISRAAPAATAPLGPIQIIINQAPGQNAQDIAAEVEKAINKIRSRDAARQRSSMRDKD